ncbi:hypothetical protein V2J09_019473 [Rumex salicifolius]
MGERSSSFTRFLVTLLLISTLLLMSSSNLLCRSKDIPNISASVFMFISSDQSLDSFESQKCNNRSATLTSSLLEDTNILSVDTNTPQNSELVSPENKTPVSNLKLDTSESGEKNDLVCDTNQACIRVYMYDMPPEFHFGLLGWKAKNNEIWPDVSDLGQIPLYPGGLNKQHSVEYWLTLDLLASNKDNIARPCTSIRVENVSQADVVFVPFFAALSYNRHSKARARGNDKVALDRRLQRQLVEFVMSRNEWKRHGGKDHVIVPHHPNSMLYARKSLGSASYVLADFGRYPSKVANLDKDVIAPYKHVVNAIHENASAPFDQRPILAYFQGAIHRKDGGAIRQELYRLMKDEKDVHFTSGSLSQRGGARTAGQGMGSSKFCLNIAGDTPSSNRLFDAIVSHCVPVMISDDIELPFEDVLDYSKFSVFVRASDATKPGFLVKLLRGIRKEEWTGMWKRLKEVARHFEYQFPSQSDDAVNMIWKAVARKVSAAGGGGGRHRMRKYRRQHTLTKHSMMI